MVASDFNPRYWMCGCLFQSVVLKEYNSPTMSIKQGRNEFHPYHVGRTYGSSKVVRHWRAIGSERVVATDFNPWCWKCVVIYFNAWFLMCVFAISIRDIENVWLSFPSVVLITRGCFFNPWCCIRVLMNVWIFIWILVWLNACYQLNS